MAFFCRKFPHAQPIVDAYVAATGRPVSWTLQREMAAHRIAAAGYTPDDVAMVLQAIHKRFEKGMAGYTSMSLSFTNAIEKFERFEDILLDLRARRKKPVSATPKILPPKGLEIPIPAQPVSDEERERIAAEARRLAAELRRNLEGGA